MGADGTRTCRYIRNVIPEATPAFRGDVSGLEIDALRKLPGTRGTKYAQKEDAEILRTRAQAPGHECQQVKHSSGRQTNGDPGSLCSRGFGLWWSF